MNGKSTVWLLTLLAFAACDLPRDPRDTLARVAMDTMRVGYIVDPPWVHAGPDGPVGIEPTLVQEFADRVRAEVAWQAGTEEELMRRLSSYELDLVIGGITRANAWGREVTLTMPYYGFGHDLRSNQHVFAVPPGENAWLVHLERFLFQSRERAEELVQAATK